MKYVFKPIYLFIYIFFLSHTNIALAGVPPIPVPVAEINDPAVVANLSVLVASINTLELLIRERLSEDFQELEEQLKANTKEFVKLKTQVDASIKPFQEWREGTLVDSFTRKLENSDLKKLMQEYQKLRTDEEEELSKLLGTKDEDDFLPDPSVFSITNTSATNTSKPFAFDINKYEKLIKDGLCPNAGDPKMANAGISSLPVGFNSNELPYSLLQYESCQRVLNAMVYKKTVNDYAIKKRKKIQEMIEFLMRLNPNTTGEYTVAKTKILELELMQKEVMQYAMEKMQFADVRINVLNTSKKYAADAIVSGSKSAANNQKSNNEAIANTAASAIALGLTGIFMNVNLVDYQ